MHKENPDGIGTKLSERMMKSEYKNGAWMEEADGKGKRRREEEEKAGFI